MSFRNKKRYIAQSEEQAIPPQERVYCPRITCRRWIHPKNKGTPPGTQVCPHCRAKACCSCGDFAHGPWPCADDEGLMAVLRMAKENKWQRCTRCHFVVEKVDGCNHISCRCGNQFWYVDKCDCARAVANLRYKSYICGGHQNRCKCPTRDPTEELGDGDLDVNTLVAAMEQANAGENVQEDDEGQLWTEEEEEEVWWFEDSVGRDQDT